MSILAPQLWLPGCSAPGLILAKVRAQGVGDFFRRLNGGHVRAGGDFHVGGFAADLVADFFENLRWGGWVISAGEYQGGDGDGRKLVREVPVGQGFRARRVASGWGGGNHLTVEGGGGGVFRNPTLGEPAGNDGIGKRGGGISTHGTRALMPGIRRAKLRCGAQKSS